jgi:hypothetical protein
MIINITRIIENKKRIIELLIIIAGFSLFLNQYYSQKADEKIFNIVEYIGVQVGFSDSRITANEHLLRYLVGKTLLTNLTDFNDTLDSYTNNNTGIYCLKTDIFGYPPPCFDLTFIFEKQSNIERYFEEVETMNIERPKLYKELGKFIEFILTKEKEVSDLRSYADTFFFITLFLYISIVVSYLVIPEPTKEVEKS